MPLSVLPPPEKDDLQEQNPDGTAAPETQEKRAPRFGRLRSNARTANLDALGQHELVTLIEDLEDDRSRARVREGIWISVIVHIVLAWLYAYGPQVLLHRPRVINPSELMAQHPKDYEFLDLPPDALKQLKPKKSDIISDKDRVAQTKHPTLDRKTLAELQAMKPAGPPAPQPGEQAKNAPAPQPTPQPSPAQRPQQPSQSVQNAPQTPQPQPVPAPTQQANNIPTPKPQQPNFNALGHSSARDQIANAAGAASRSGGGDFGSGAPSRHPGINTGMEILSDTMGVDFGAYMQKVKFQIERAWYPIIPESALPPLNKQGVVQIRFRIGPDGQLVAGAMSLDGRSGDVSLDRAAWGGVTGGSPFPPLPKEFKGPYLEIRGAFLYNLTPDQLK